MTLVRRSGGGRICGGIIDVGIWIMVASKTEPRGECGICIHPHLSLPALVLTFQPFIVRVRFSR